MNVKRYFHFNKVINNNNKINLINQLARQFYNGDCIQAKQEVKWLNQFLLNSKNEYKLEDLLNRRIQNNEPLQYILGDQPFGPLNIKVRPPILIPRWETEEWTHELANLINHNLTKNSFNLKILEIGCGSGCISLLLSHSLIKKRVSILGIDINDQAIQLSELNRKIHLNQLNNSVAYFQCDLFNDHDIAKIVETFGQIDMIVSNPPYIPPDHYHKLTQDVKDWEDSRALTTRDELGLEFYSRILDLYKSSKLFNKNTILNQEKQSSQLPHIVVEYAGNYQSQYLINLVKSYGGEIDIRKDLANQDRVAYIQL